MKTEKQIKDFLESCGKVRDFGLSSGPCPANTREEDPDDPDSRRGCCAECSMPSALEWVLDEREDGSANGQIRLIEALRSEAEVVQPLQEPFPPVSPEVSPTSSP